MRTAKIGVLLLVGVCAVALLALAPPAVQPAPAPWSFAVSGDSRNCGDIVMPAIAGSVLKRQARFYWHLGDLPQLDFRDPILAHASHNRTHRQAHERFGRRWTQARRASRRARLRPPESVPRGSPARSQRSTVQAHGLSDNHGREAHAQGH